ncbi:hypothetical protein ABFS83_10G025700 [Erythranthe nasuta]
MEPNPSSSAFPFWVSKSVNFLKNKSKFPNRFSSSSSTRFRFDGMVVNNSLYYCPSPNSPHPAEMATPLLNQLNFSIEEETAETSSISDFLSSEVSSSPHCSTSEVSDQTEKPHSDKLQENEMMKERFAKLLLGEDMSGCGNGVCTALAISNAITNLCATLFGQIWRLEPLKPDKKSMWRREMEWLLCVSDHIVELIPSWQTFPDGTKLEVMTSRPRSDLYSNLPALCKLDNMLLEILDSFESSEFWYVEQGILTPEGDGSGSGSSSSFRKILPRQVDKWWLPIPRVPPGGLTENARKMLQHRRDSTNQILKAAMAINNAALADMDIPELYLEALPKNGKASLGDLIHRYINSDQYSPECLLDCLDLSSEHHALEIANRVEATIHVWRRKTNSKPLNHYTTQRSNSKSSWEIVKDLVIDADKRELLASRAETLLLCLKQRFPGLPQTTLDTSKIQCNKDVGKSILEGYSRVLESLAFNIVARIDDLIYVDDLSKNSDQLVSISMVGVISHKNVKTTFMSPRLFSPSQLIGHAEVDKSPYIESSKLPLRGIGVKRILTDYLSIDGKGRGDIGRSDSFSKQGII